MTKPCNFPGKKLARRVSALERLEKWIAHERAKSTYEQRITGANRLFLMEREAATLRERIANPGAYFTKKRRTGKRQAGV
jgi:hypothetical protein